jgi:hypothetical protein
LIFDILSSLLMHSAMSPFIIKQDLIKSSGRFSDYISIFVPLSPALPPFNKGREYNNRKFEPPPSLTG